MKIEEYLIEESIIEDSTHQETSPFLGTLKLLLDTSILEEENYE